MIKNNKLRTTVLFAFLMILQLLPLHTVEAANQNEDNKTETNNIVNAKNKFHNGNHIVFK